MNLTNPMLMTLMSAGAACSVYAEQARLELVDNRARASSPVAVIVHGINPADGELDPLAHHLVARGFQTHMFHYDSDERLESSARLLGSALRGVAENSSTERVAVIGHSMGGLIARRALTAAHEARLGELDVRFDLITIASPLGGFPSANWSWLGLGFTPGSFRDLGTRSRFIQEPGELADNVRHIKIETDETGALRLEGDRWLDDDVVGLQHQVHDLVDREADRVHRITVGHTHVVNAYGNVHTRLTQLFDEILPSVNDYDEPRPLPESVMSTSS